MPKFSIILPCYNVENHIEKAIRSVLNQTYTDFELLVVIDGSPDNSVDIANRMAKEDKRITVFEKPNGGLSDARNYGLERAKGEFVYFMDSDDWIEPTLLEDNLKIVEEETLDFVVFGYIQDNEDKQGNLISSIKVVPTVDAYIKGDDSKSIDAYHLGILGYAWNKIYRRAYLKINQLKFTKGISLVEDILFNSYVYAFSDTIKFNQKAYYHYINREEVTLMKRFHENSFDLIKNKTKVIGYFADYWHLKNKKQLLSNSLIQGIRYSVHNLYSFENQLSDKEKKIYVRKMLNDYMTRDLIQHYPANSFRDKVYKFFIKNKIVFPIITFAKLTK